MRTKLIQLGGSEAIDLLTLLFKNIPNANKKYHRL